MNEEVERVLAAAQDSLTDDMVARIAGAATDAIDLVDRANRSGLGAAIPALAELVANGDLERLAKLARLYGSAEDALTDEMVGRLAELLAEAASLLDRLCRAGTLARIADQLDNIERLLGALAAAEAETAKAPRSAGGVGGMLAVMRDPDTQDALRFLANFGKALRKPG